MQAVSLADETMEEALAFSRATFGARSYQAQPSYLAWLYEDNPWSAGHGACRLLMEDGRIVGIIHNMQLPVSLDGTECTLSVLHNLILDPGYRGGMGILFARQEVSRQALMFAPGMQGDYREAFRKFRYREFRGQALRRILRPVHGAATKAARRAGLAGESLVLRGDPARGVHARVPPGLRAAFAERSGLHRIMRAEDVEPFVAWRYFSESGPRHVLIHDEATGAFCLCSVGVRHGFNVARIMELVDATPGFLSDRVVPALRRLKAHLLLAFVWDGDIAGALAGIGMRATENPVSSFQAGKLSRQVGIVPQSGISDYGFEALLTA